MTNEIPTFENLKNIHVKAASGALASTGAKTLGFVS